LILNAAQGKHHEWWTRLLRRSPLEAQLDAELRDHIKRQIADEGGHQRAADCLSRKGCVALRDSRRETLVNLSITGHLRSFSDQPVRDVDS
jgi:hypothetical protein